MEIPDPGKKVVRKSSNSHISISDTESIASQVDSFHSPLRSESPLRSDDPSFHPENGNRGKTKRSNEGADKYYSAIPSPRNPSLKVVSPVSGGGEQNPLGRGPPLVVVYNRSVKEEAPPGVTKVGPAGGDVRPLEEGYGGGRQETGGDRRSGGAMGSILRRSRREVNSKRAALGFRIIEVIFCLISFSVMAADKTKGWSGDSFDHYIEYRYCLAMNIIGFIYSGFQACDLTYHLTKGKPLFSHQLRYHFDFAMDQILAYLLMSASSSAATRLDDWMANWGKDDFTSMASASISLSFLAFVAFAISALISGYNLCCQDST